MKKFSKHALMESFIIGSEPLESSMKLRSKIDNISYLLNDYETIVLGEISNDSEDYTADTIDLKNDIRAILNDIKWDSLEISLGDYIKKFKKE